MKPSIAVHASCGVYSTQFAKLAGVIESTCAGLDIVDANLYFDDDNIPAVAAYLYTTVPYWPDRSIFLSVVGRGRLVAVQLPSGSILIGPDNGFAAVTVEHYGFEKAYLIDIEKFGGDEWASARLAARLADGMPIETCGEPLAKEDLYVFRIPKAHIEKGLAEGQVIMLLKTFGNITFNIGTDEFEETEIRHGDMVHVVFTHNDHVEWEETVSYQPSFGYVEKGQPVVFNGSSGYMDIGLNMESFIQTCIPQILELEDPGEFKVRIEKVEE